MNIVIKKPSGIEKKMSVMGVEPRNVLSGVQHPNY